MKRIILFLSLCLVLLYSAECVYAQKNKIVQERQCWNLGPEIVDGLGDNYSLCYGTLRGNVESITMEEYQLLDRNGSEETGVLISRVTYRFNGNGDVLERNINNFYNYNQESGSINGSSSGWSDKFEYDSMGKLTQESYYDSYGSLTTRRGYVYNSFGDITEESRYNSNGRNNYRNTYAYKYDSDGKMLEKYSYSSSGSLVSAQKYCYNLSGNLVEDWSYGSDGTLGTQRKYDSQGNLIEEYIPGSEWYEKYTFDSSGKRLEFSYNRYGNKGKATYIYDSVGKLLEIVYYDSVGMVSSNEKTTYDLNGNPVNGPYLNSDGLIEYAENRVYDSLGNKIMDEYQYCRYKYVYDSLGNLIMMKEYDGENLTPKRIWLFHIKYR